MYFLLLLLLNCGEREADVLPHWLLTTMKCLFKCTTKSWIIENNILLQITFQINKSYISLLFIIIQSSVYLSREVLLRLWKQSYDVFCGSRGSFPKFDLIKRSWWCNHLSLDLRCKFFDRKQTWGVWFERFGHLGGKF